MSGQRRFNPGDRVSLLNEVGGGTVLAIVGNRQVKVLTDDGFELVFGTGDLVLVHCDPSLSVSEHDARLRASNDRLAEMVERGKGRGATMANGGQPHKQGYDPHVVVVDLHLEKLVADENSLSDGEKLSFQLGFFERQLNTAIRERKKRVIVIHGVGEGILREEVRKTLQFYNGVRFDDADPRIYGHGATAIEILHY